MFGPNKCSSWQLQTPTGDSIAHVVSILASVAVLANYAELLVYVNHPSCSNTLAQQPLWKLTQKTLTFPCASKSLVSLSQFM